MKTHTDQKYIVALLNHNSALIEEIYKKCSVQCEKYVKQNSGTVAEAKDIFQEAMAALYHQAKKGLILQAPVCAYLYLVYKGKWLNLLKSKKRKRKQLSLRNDGKDGYIHEPPYSTDDNLIETIKEQIFMDCFDKLSADAKQLFNLRYKDKLPSKEIARQLNIEDNTVNQRFSYYKQKLKDCVEQHPDIKELH